MAAIVKCPDGHANSVNQKFCGECGLPLVGLCPNGHRNPEGQRYCGECGQPLNRLDAASDGSSVTPSPVPAPRPESAEPLWRSAMSQRAQQKRPPNQVPPRPGAETYVPLPPLTAPTPSAQKSSRTPQIGDVLILPHGIDATVVACDEVTVWLRTEKGGYEFGTSKHPRSDVEASLAEKRIAFANQPVASNELGGDPQGAGIATDRSGSPGSTTGITSGGGKANRLKGFWVKLTTWGKVAVVGAAGSVLVLLLSLAGTFDSPKLRECMKFSAGEYELARGEQPDAAEQAVQERVCQRLIDDGLWR
jgi:hypothetical protein